MKLSTIAAVACIAASVVAIGTGCSRKKATPPEIAGSGEIGEFTPMTQVEGEDGLPLTGSPFDETYQKISDFSEAPIYFGYASYVLPPLELAKIQRVADFMNSDSKVVLIIAGHCDERGSNEYNLSLGEYRALAVRSYLVNLGVSADRIQSRSYGEEKPAVTGSGEAVWKLNRRGEFMFYR